LEATSHGGVRNIERQIIMVTNNKIAAFCSIRTNPKNMTEN
jgi:hypothetical protein